jgi:hypothetical protein
MLYRARVDAHGLSQMAAFPKIQEALSAGINHVNDIKSQNLPNALKRYMQDNITDVLSRAASSRRPAQTLADTFVNRLSSFVHTAYLAASPGYFPLQFSQVYTKLLPELFKVKGNSFVKTLQTINGNTPMAFKIMKEVLTQTGGSGVNGWSAGWARGITPEALKAAGLGADKAAALMNVVNRGDITLSGYSHMLDQLGGNEGLNPVSRTLKLANATAAMSEAFPRLVAALSAHDMYRGSDALGKADYMSQVTRASMRDWGAQTATPAQQNWLGKASPLVGQFHQYQVKTINQFYHMAYDAMKGDTPESQAEARRWLGAHAAAAMTFAGTLGLPAAGWIAGAINKGTSLFNGGEGFDPEEHYREFLTSMVGKDLGEVIAHGLPRAIGLDVAKYGDNDLAPFTKLMEDRRKWQDAFPDYLADAAGGAAGGFINNTVLGLQDVFNGRVIQGMSKFLPTAVRNMVGAYRLGTEGYLDSQERPMPITPGATDILATALGLKPSKLAEAQEAIKDANGIKYDREFRANNIKENLFHAIDQHDQAGIEKWAEAAKQFDQDPAHLNNMILPNAVAEYTKREQQVNMAKALKTPIGVSATDQFTRGMVNSLNQ